MRHKAIYKVYPECIGITDDVGAYDSNQKLIKIDESLIQAKIKELETAEPMRLLRVERNQKLAETDWWAVADRTMTAEQTAYRTALRDLPATQEPKLDSQGNLTNVTWPEAPA